MSLFDYDMALNNLYEFFINSGISDSYYFFIRKTNILRLGSTLIKGIN